MKVKYTQGFSPVLALLSLSILVAFCFFTLLTYKNMPTKHARPISTFIPTIAPKEATPTPILTPIACGGIAGLVCPDGFICKITDSYPDAMGECVEN